MPRVSIIRHAPTRAAAEERLTGRLDLDLSPLGVAQAKRYAPTLADRDFDLVITSSLRRARATARALLPHVETLVDERWNERSLGAWEGELARVVRERQPSAFTERGSLDLSVHPPGGETLEQVTTRVRAAITDLRDRSRAREVLVVTHAGVIRTTRYLLGHCTLAQASDADAACLELVELYV